MPHSTTFWRALPGGGLCLISAVLLASGCASNLNKAASGDHPEKVDQLIATGANVNQADKDGATPLINAAQSGKAPVIRKLVESGANVNAVDHDGYSALMRLVAGDDYHNDAVDYLLRHGARTDLWSSDGETVLLMAAKREVDPAQAVDQTQLISLLLAAGADPAADTRTGEHPLQLAAEAGQPDPTLALLLKTTPGPAQLDRTGLSALSTAARGDRRGAQAFLVRQGLTPQHLEPASPTPFLGIIRVDPFFPITARACDAYGDYLMTQGASGAALDTYRQSAGAYTAAVDQYQGAVERCSAALKKQKEARRNRIMGAVFVDTLGIGLAAATGVGFVAIPKRVPNDIDELSDQLDLLQAGLKSLQAEDVQLTAKLAQAQASPPRPPAGASGL
jgi:ankyrin repeat protein